MHCKFASTGGWSDRGWSRSCSQTNDSLGGPARVRVTQAYHVFGTSTTTHRTSTSSGSRACLKLAWTGLVSLSLERKTEERMNERRFAFHRRSGRQATKGPAKGKRNRLS